MHSLHPWILLDITRYLTTKTCMMLECTNLFQGENNAGSSSIPANKICSTQISPLTQGRAWKYSSSENTSEVDYPGFHVYMLEIAVSQNVGQCPDGIIPEMSIFHV